MTWDGKISTHAHTPSVFSSAADKRQLLEIRADCDAILVGRSTLEADNMTMGLSAEDLRLKRSAKGQAPYPTRVLASNSGRLSPALRVFQNQNSPIHIYSTEQMPAKTRKALTPLCALHLQQGDRVDLKKMLRDLRVRHGIERLVCEGGPTLFRSLLEEDLIDEIHLTICPLLFGGQKALTLTGAPASFLPSISKWKLRDLKNIGNECFLRYTR